MHKVIGVHGWYGRPTDGWWPWIKSNLEAQDFTVKIPQMPNPESPLQESWIAELKKTVPFPDKNTYFLGHSLGCITILKYLQELPVNHEVGGVVLVAGFTEDLSFKGYHKELSNFFKDEIKWEHIRSISPKFTVISSDNDPTVAKENHDRLVAALNADGIWEHNKLHMTGDDGIYELPSALEALVKMS